MKLLVATIILFTSVPSVHSQPTDFLELIFRDSSNLAITKVFHQYPKKIFVLRKSAPWNADRFILRQSTRHAEAKDPYIFSDTSIANLFSVKEKQFLANMTFGQTNESLNTAYRKINFISTDREVGKGFLFSISKPVFTSDSLYAFIDLQTYYKEGPRSEFHQSYYGSVFFIYRRSDRSK